MARAGVPRSTGIALAGALLLSGTLAAAGAGSEPAIPFGPPPGTASAIYHATWATSNAHLTNAPETLDGTITASRGDDGSLRLSLGDKLVGTLDAAGDDLKAGDDSHDASRLREDFDHLVGLMRGHPNLVDGAAWKAPYRVREHGAGYQVSLDVSVSVRGDALHVTAQGRGGGPLVERSGDSTILENADYVAGALQKASGHETTLERWGANEAGVPVDNSWSVEAK